MIKNYNIEGKCTAETYNEECKCKYSVVFGMSNCVFNRKDYCMSVAAGDKKEDSDG